MQIDRFNKIKDHRCFRDFKWPASLPCFARFNLIYGWNGSGKSTLADLFKLLEARNPSTKIGVEVQLSNSLSTAIVRGDDFGTAVVPRVRVFDRHYSEQVIAKREVRTKPIYYFGKEVKDGLEKLESARIAKADATTRLSNAEALLKKATKAEELFREQTAKVIKDQLVTANRDKYLGFNAGVIRSRFQQMLDPTEGILDQASLEVQLGIKSSERRELLRFTKTPRDNLVALCGDVISLLNKEVTGDSIKELVDNPEIAMWVLHGLGLHTGGNKSERCHFCNNHISPERMRALESHFNEAVRKFQGDLDRCKDRVSAFIRQMEIKWPSASGIYPHLSSRYEDALSEYSHAAERVAEALGEYLNALSTRIESPLSDPSIHRGIQEKFEVMGLDATLRKCEEQVEDFVEEHNRLSRDHSQQVAAACQAIEKHYTSAAYHEYVNLNEAIKTQSAAVEVEKEKIQTLDADIAGYAKGVKDLATPAEELNAEIASLLGNGSLKFKVHDDGYELIRGESGADHLSEGERNAIALLYFLKSLRDSDGGDDSQVIVLDDPVTSLDSNALFSAFSFVKTRLAKFEQVFILSHDFQFFRLVRKWFLAKNRKWFLATSVKKPKPSPAVPLPVPAKQAEFFMLECSPKDDLPLASILTLDPLLMKYESDYQYLFSQILRASKAKKSHRLEEFYKIPNIARRFMEAFLAFRFPNSSGNLTANFGHLQPEDVRERVINFLHAFSHYDAIGSGAHNPSMLSETPGVMRGMLTLIEKEDPNHVARLKKAVAQSRKL